MATKLSPPPSIIDLVTNNKTADSIWKKWFSLLRDYILAKRYANIYASENSTETAIAASNTWYQITVFDTNGPDNILVADYTNAHIVIKKTGVYLVAASISLDGTSGGGRSYEVTVFTNNGATELANVHGSTRLSGASKEQMSITIIGIALLNDGDTLETWIKNLTGTENALVEDISLTAIDIGI